MHSSAGQLIRSIPWEGSGSSGSMRGLGWADDEKLVVVGQDGTVRVYLDLQGDFAQFSLGHGADDFGVESCRFYATGMVALLGNNALVSVASYDEPRPRLLAQPPEGKVHSWAVIPPSSALATAASAAASGTLSVAVEVLLSIGETIHVADSTDCDDRFLDIGPFSHVSVSPNGRFVCLYTATSAGSAATGKAHVVTADFQTRLTEWDSGSRTRPRAVEWCGSDAVVVAWEDEVTVVGPGGESAPSYLYDGRVHVVPDVDGVRLVTNAACDFVQKVPAVTEEVFKFGTHSPAAILLDAVEQLELRSPKADDNIQLIRAELVEAVDSCVGLVLGQNPADFVEQNG